MDRQSENTNDNDHIIMMKNAFLKNLVPAAAAAMFLACGTAAAQEQDFDLSSQRSEKQGVNPVPGHPVDRGGLCINPVPRKMQVDSSSWADLSKGLRIKDPKGLFGEDFGFAGLSEDGLKVRVDFGRRYKGPGVPGAYRLEVGPKGIIIDGFDEAGAFYGIQTLRELMQSPAASEGKLPCLTVGDWPELPYRGVVEGFYGNPWPHSVRKALIGFYGKYKMNTYLYGPKDDPYHSCPSWRLPYPEDKAREIKELVDECRRNRVEFVWAIHPGQDIKWNEEDYARLLAKFESMYSLGVRSFAIFFDDISGEGTDPLMQTGLLNRLNRDFVRAKGDVAPLTVCPTDYSRLWANPGPQGSLAVYGRTLDKDIKVFWTGDVVCSDLTRETMQWLNSRIGRPGYYWWNFPVTDYVHNIVMQGPAYGLDTTLDATDLCGIVSNPMEHGEASRLALYGVADYAWNPSAYNPLDNWERALRAVEPGAADAYRTFAIHSCDTETGYRRDESWETEVFRLDNWDDAAAAALREEFSRICDVPARMEEHASEALLKELRPWLVEFGKIGRRGTAAIDLMEMYRGGACDSLFWDSYARAMMTAADRDLYEAHKSGTMKLHPFYENAMDDLADAFLTRLLGHRPMLLRGMSSFANGATVQTKLMFDGDPQTYYTSGASQSTGDWIGVDLGGVFAVDTVSVLQGRNSVDDVDYFDHAVMECSADGKTWTRLGDTLVRCYEPVWKGEPVQARYVRLRKLESAKKNYAAVRSFTVNPPDASALGIEGPQDAVLAFDARLSTAFSAEGGMTFRAAEGVSSYVLLCGNAPCCLEFEMYDSRGCLLGTRSCTGTYARIPVYEGTSYIKVSGQGTICEIIPQM